MQDFVLLYGDDADNRSMRSSVMIRDQHGYRKTDDTRETEAEMVGADLEHVRRHQTNDYEERSDRRRGEEHVQSDRRRLGSIKSTTVRSTTETEMVGADLEHMQQRQTNLLQTDDR